MALGDMANSCNWMLTLVACDEDRNGRRNALVREQEKDAVTASTWALQLHPPWQMHESLLVAPWKLQKTHPQSSIIWTLKKRLLMSANIRLQVLDNENRERSSRFYDGVQEVRPTCEGELAEERPVGL